MLRSQLVKGTTELLILAVLEDGELYGYQIAQRIRERGGEGLTFSEGTLYPALHRLEQRGALGASWAPGEAGPRRRYYHLTDAGRGLLAEARREFDAYVSEVQAVAGTVLGRAEHA